MLAKMLPCRASLLPHRVLRLRTNPDYTFGSASWHRRLSSSTRFGNLASEKISPSPLHGPLLNRVWEQALKSGNRIACVDAEGMKWTYQQLASDVQGYAKWIELQCQGQSLRGERVALLCPNSYQFIVSLLALWSLRAVAVPLCTTHPVSEMRYVLQDCQACLMLSHPSLDTSVVALQKTHSDVPAFPTFSSNAKSVPDKTLKVADPISGSVLDEDALIIYTSGTTGKPKGVVHTHRSLKASLDAIHSAWHRNPNDAHLGILPLHHVHGLVNIVLGSLYCSGWIWFPSEFDGTERTSLKKQGLWAWYEFWESAIDQVSAIHGEPSKVVLQAVPTLYAQWLQQFHQLDSSQQRTLRELLQKRLRLCVSGSSALPASIFYAWERDVGGLDIQKATQDQLKQWRLLERYGMTEIGMALSNPYEGERLAGTVGQLLPGVEAQLVQMDQNRREKELALVNELDKPGELWIRGDSVFKAYWQRPEATAECLRDRWFQTGDIAERTRTPSGSIYYRLLGRSSVDIIKSGGYKISALEIEREILEHGGVKEAVVLGLSDRIWGERVAALVVLKESAHRFSLEELQQFLKPRLANYKLPTVLETLDQIPRNAMGKVNKKWLASHMFEDRLNRKK